MNKISVKPQGFELLKQEIERAYIDACFCVPFDYDRAEVGFALTAVCNYLYRAHIMMNEVIDLHEKSRQTELEMCQGHNPQKGGKQ